MARKTTIAILVALLLSILVIAIILSVSAKWPWIEVPYPVGTDTLRFIKYIACSAAMCNGEGGDGNICESTQVIAVGQVEFGNETKTCRELCYEKFKNNPDFDDDLKNKERYCGKEYALEFTFKEDTIVDDLQLRKFSSFYGDIIHIACYRCVGGGWTISPVIRAQAIDLVPIGYTQPTGVDESVIGFFGAGKCMVGSPEWAGSVWIENETYISNCTYDEKKGITSCFFAKGSKAWIWSEKRFTKKWKDWGWWNWVLWLGEILRIPGGGQCGVVTGKEHICPQIVVLPNEDPSAACSS